MKAASGKKIKTSSRKECDPSFIKFVNTDLLLTIKQEANFYTEVLGLRKYNTRTLRFIYIHHNTRSLR